jgi:subtilisin family serine protease
VIGVSAVDSAGVVAGFSSENLSVQVAAPGVSVPAQGRDGQYWWVSGTSPACALIAGVAALIKSAYPGLAPHLVASAMTSTTTERPASGYDNRVGFGIVNAAAALTRAGQLSRDRPVATGVAATTQFRGSAVAEPVGPRGQGQLVLYTAAALASLTLAGTAARLMLSRRTRR